MVEGLLSTGPTPSSRRTDPATPGPLITLSERKGGGSESKRALIVIVQTRTCLDQSAREGGK